MMKNSFRRKKDVKLESVRMAGLYHLNLNIKILNNGSLRTKKKMIRK